MSIKSGSMALSVFRIEQDMRFASSFLNREALFIHRFRPIDETPEWSTAVGWTGFEDMLDPDFSASHPQIGEYLAFSLRADRRAVPPAVLKKHYAQALRKEEEANRESGKKFISRERKKELLEQVKTRLTAKAEPVPASCGVVVNTRTGLVFLGSASPKVAEAFQAMFAKTFTLDLLPLDACLLAGEPEAGRVFLTRVFSHGLTVPARDIDENTLVTDVTLSFAGRVVVVDEEAELSGTAKNGGDIAEIEAGVEAGKEVIKLGLRLDWEPDSFTMTLDQYLRLTGLRLPAGAGEGFKDDPDGAFLERMYLIEKAVAAIHAACKAAWTDNQAGIAFVRTQPGVARMEAN